jgi:thiamine biosynthesis lipoprotein
VFEDKLQVLGSNAQISIAGLSAEDAKQAALAVANDLQALDFTGYTLEAGGELQQLNEALAQGRSMTVSDGLAELIREAKQLSTASGGLFNPAAGALTAFWEVRCDNDECSEPPFPDEVRRQVDEQTAKIISGQPSMQDLVIDANTVSSNNRLVKLEFGDMIRGLALDKGIEHLGRAGVSNAMIDIGGSVRTMGRRGDHDWWIGVPDADGRHSIGSIENIDGQAVVSVRAFEQSFGKQGSVYRRIVDPRSGRPVGELQSVTVVHDNATVASVVAVSVLIAGINDWKLLAGKLNTDKILAIAADGTIFVSPSMEHLIHWEQGVEHQHLVP